MTLSSPVFMPCGHYKTVVITAPGPSLCKEQVDIIMNCPWVFNIAIGDAWNINKYADILYHCDKRWWTHYNGVPEFKGCQRVSLDDTEIPFVHRLEQSLKQDGIDFQKPYIATGMNSGHQAINLAAHYRPETIILCGYDMKKSKDGKHNVIGDHPKPVKTPADFNLFRQAIATTVKPLADVGISVYNCTIDSALECFPKGDLKDVLFSQR